MNRISEVLHVKEEMLRAEPPYSKNTIDTYMKDLIYLNKYTDLSSPQTVSTYIRSIESEEKRKQNLFTSYGIYCKVYKIQKPEKLLRGGLKRVYKKVPEVPKEEILDKIIDNANVFYSVIFEFLKETGVRTIELTNLRIKDLKENIITVQTAKVGGMATRQLRISDKLLDRLNRHVIKGRSEGYVFERKGRQLNEQTLRKRMIFYRERVSHKYNIPDAESVHLHTFRHFYASKLYQETKDIVLVKTFLGHSNIKSTEIYTHIIKFNNDRFVAKAIPIENVDEICKMLSEGWNVVTTT